MTMIDKALDLHARSLDVRSRRLEVLAQNIANGDTPNYKARDIDFREALAKAQEGTLRRTHASHHADPDEKVPDGVKYRNPFNTAFDGNTVELNVEHAHYGKAAADYQASLNFLEQRVSSLRKAMRGE